MAAESHRAAMAAGLAYPTHPLRKSQLRGQAGHVVVSGISSNKSHSSPASLSRDEQSSKWKKMSRREPRSPRPLIKVSTSDGRYHGEWTSEYALTLQDLRLSDLVSQDGDKSADVLVELYVQKHAGFGFSIDGRVNTCFSSVCNSCFCSYRREIDTTFNVWVLPSSRSSEVGLPEIGGNDPSVIYVKPGSDAELDSLIRDTIQLTASTKDTCSEACQRSTIRWQFTDGKKSYDKRWSRLLMIKRSK